MTPQDTIKNWMSQNGITQKDLAEMVGCSTVTIHNFLSGKRRTNLAILKRIRGIMADKEDMKLNIPSEIEPIIRAWARDAHITVDRLANEILAQLLRVKIPPRGNDLARSFPQGVEEEEVERFMAADDSPGYDDAMDPFA